MNGLGEWDDEAEPEATSEDPEPDTDTNGGGDADPPLFYANLDQFVREYVIKVFRRRVGDRGPHRWDAQWWRSTEAQVRLDAMWRSWEEARQKPAGMAAWLSEVADVQMAALWDPEGPFKYATSSNEAGAPLPYEPPPSTLFAAADEQTPQEGGTEGG